MPHPSLIVSLARPLQYPLNHPTPPPSQLDWACSLTEWDFLHDHPGGGVESAAGVGEAVARTLAHQEPDLSISIPDPQIAGLHAESRDGGRHKDILRHIGGDAGADVLVLGTGRAVDLDPPARAAVGAVSLPDAALPCDTQHRVVVLLGEDHLGDDAHVALTVHPQVREEVLTVVGGVGVLHGGKYPHFGHAHFTCRRWMTSLKIKLHFKNGRYTVSYLFTV